MDIKEYFEFNGRQYYYGTIVKFKTPKRGTSYKNNIKRKGDWMYGFYTGVNNSFDVIDRPNINPRTDLFEFKYAANVYPNDIAEIIYFDPNANTDIKIWSDLQDEDVVYGWIGYIFLMALVSIFRGNIFYWLALTIWFFDWRHRKLYRKKWKHDKAKNYY